jgi:hypothetical protein
MPKGFDWGSRYAKSPSSFGSNRVESRSLGNAVRHSYRRRSYQLRVRTEVNVPDIPSDGNVNLLRTVMSLPAELSNRPLDLNNLTQIATSAVGAPFCFETSDGFFSGESRAFFSSAG